MKSSYNDIIGPENEALRSCRDKYSTVAVQDVPESTLEALRNGEEWAYNDVYMRYAAPVKDFLAALIRDEEDAKELNHDVFLSLWTGRDKIVSDRGIRGFLYMRAKHLAMNYFDRKKVKQKYVDFCQRDPALDFSPDQYVMGKEIEILIEIALRGMSEQQRTIFRMKYDQGHSVDEIAAALNLSRSTIKNNLTMITKSLRQVVAMFMVFFYY